MEKEPKAAAEKEKGGRKQRIQGEKWEAGKWDDQFFEKLYNQGVFCGRAAPKAYT